MGWKDDKSQVMVYMPPEMHKGLKSIAAANKDSVNNVILEMLTEKLELPVKRKSLDLDYEELAKKIVEYQTNDYKRMITELNFLIDQMFKYRDKR